MGRYRRSTSEEAIADRVRIDYDNLSAADIMRQIKEETAKRSWFWIEPGCGFA